MGVGAPEGNKNAANGSRARRAILRALARHGQGSVAEGLNKIADKLVLQADKGESWAQKEIYDRIDGKPKQQTEITGAGGKNLVVEIVRFGDKTPS